MAFQDAAMAGRILTGRRRRTGLPPQGQMPDATSMMPAMQDGEGPMGLKDKFIQKAIKRPGQLHRDLGVAQGQKIPGSKLRAALTGRYGAKTAQRARFARTLSGLGK